MMNIIGLLDRPTEGEYFLNNKKVAQLNESELNDFRKDTIGFVFQQFLLIPTRTAMQNVMLPMYFKNNKDLSKRAVSLLDKVGLSKRCDHLPSQLSGGEMQRVAIARTLANEPSILLADEPTGNLDSKTAQEIYDLFKNINAEGTTVVMITHNHEIAAALPRTINLYDGKVLEQ